MTRVVHAGRRGLRDGGLGRARSLPVSSSLPVSASVVLLALVLARPAGAQEPMNAPGIADSAELVDRRAAELDARAAEIAARLRCPVCSGQSVLESNASISQEMQRVIRERLGRGESEEEILAYFRSAYGDWIVLQPRATGLNLLVYLLPVGVLLAGAAWLFVVLRRWSARPADDAPSGPPPHERGELSAEDEAWLRRSIGGR